MKKSTTILYAITLFVFASYANCAQEQKMEQCKVVDKDGNNLIRKGMADSGYNISNDDNAWIWVPAGECAKINAGDLSGVGMQIREKLHPSNIQEAQTIE